ncbi:MAG: MFS transporter [Phycisphaerales bacterium]|nr:MFS transporter [Phycisphaerales bacterium]
MKKSPIGSLSLLMFFQYAVWGVWLPYLASYLGADPIVDASGARTGGGLGFSGAQIGWILGLAGSIGAIAAPFLAGQIADRFINAEKYLGILLIIGGLIKFATASAHSYESFMLLSIGYSIAYMPTLALTNSIAFAHLENPDRSFGPVRTWGTIGWIVASNAFPLVWLQTNLHPTALPPFLAGTPKPDQAGLIADALRVSGVGAVLYGVWAMLMLPKTPPTRSSEHPLAFLNAFGLFTKPGLLVITIVALPIAMIHQVYFIRTSPFLEAIGFDTAYVGPIMSIGQVSEIVFLTLLGYFLKRLGFRWVLALGCLAYFLRFALFAIATEETRWIAASSNALHGLCYGFFFAGAYIYVERVAPKDLRHSAQTVFAIIILGVGPVLAGFYNGWLSTIGKETDGAITDWGSLWWVQGVIGLVCAVLIAAAFRMDPGSDAEAEPSEEELADTRAPSEG